MSEEASSSKRRSRSDQSEGDDSVFVNPEDEDELEASNLSDVEPYKGMRLEIRDSDYIWSAGYIVDVEKTRNKTMVNVASDGWGRQWDELMEWPNSRIAKLYTYTKQVKSNLDLLSKKKNRKPTRDELSKLPKGALNIYSTLWPITVQFRMPHPGVKHARESLRLEDKVFVKPYGMKLLPSDIRQLMVHDGGCWFHHSRLRLWRENPEMSGVLHPNYMKAAELLEADTAIKGYLPSKALESNSLLRETFRVYDIRGCDTFDGVLYESTPPKRRRKLDKESDKHENEPHDEDKPPSVVSITNGAVMEENEPDYSSSPKLPPPIRIKEPLYPNSGVSKCERTNQWIASVCMNGNQVFLGSFPTESQAYIATRKATGDENAVMPIKKSDAHLLDLQAVTMESIIDAYETQNDPSIHTFSLHKWAIGKINHHFYVMEKRAREEPPSQDLKPRPFTEPKRKNKRKGIPKKRT